MTTTQSSTAERIAKILKINKNLIALTIDAKPTSRPNYRTNQIAYLKNEIERRIAEMMTLDADAAGWVTAEMQMVTRLALARKAGIARPELKARLIEIRKQLAA